MPGTSPANALGIRIGTYHAFGSRSSKRNWLSLHNGSHTLPAAPFRAKFHPPDRGM
jgi:hypothetical protein